MTQWSDTVGAGTGFLEGTGFLGGTEGEKFTSCAEFRGSSWRSSWASDSGACVARGGRSLGSDMVIVWSA